MSIDGGVEKAMQATRSLIGGDRTGQRLFVAAKPRGATRTLVLPVLLLVLLSACSSAPYRPDTLAPIAFDDRAAAQSSGDFNVRAYVPGADEAESIFGIDVYSRDVQPVWLEVHNAGATRARAVISSVDPKYFPPAEVAWFFKKKFSREGWMDLERRLIDLSLPRYIEPGETASGFIFTNASPGTKAFNLDVFRGTMPPEHEQFTFFLRVPGFVPDYANVRLSELYPEEQLVSVTVATLPAQLSEFGCCTSNPDGSQPGRPVNVYFVGKPLVLLRSLLRAGWVETPSGSADDSVPVHHLFGRPADGVFRKPRDGASDRSELALWSTPVRVDGAPLWAAQVRHAVGRKFTLGDRLFGVRLDPDADESRNYVLQTFWYAQTLEQWGLSPSGRLVPESAPELDFLDNPWFATDGYQVVIWLSDEPIPMNEATYLEWDEGDAAQAGGP